MADEIIRVKYDGRLAATGQLHFYEYSRSQYAFARFIATIEHFRRTGGVANKITASSNIPLIIKSPERGSFIVEVVVPVVQTALPTIVSTNLSALISYVWHTMLPRREKTDDLLENLSKIRLAEIRSGVSISKENTQQMKSLESIIKGEQATTQQALSLLKWAIESPNVAIGRAEMTRHVLEDSKKEIESEQKREQEFADGAEELAKIDEDTMNKLTSRLRPMVPEIGLPLKRSADSIGITNSDSSKRYVYINDDIVREIESRKALKGVERIVGHIKSYDRDSGVGKVSSGGLPRILNFSVPFADRARLRDFILEAMRRQNVVLSCRKIVDKSGLPTSLILIDVELTTEDDQ